MATWITRLDESGVGPRLAVKDCFDIAGTVTTVGCKALADEGFVATADADVVSSMRANGARVVGKTNLHELCFGTSGENEWSGTPVNPLDPTLIPGGSSSGSAVAVATGEADIGLGTDTGGSVRIPAACCGVVGLKTTLGRISTAGVWPLAPSFDTVGPLARDVAGVITAMDLIEPGFAAAPSATVVGRLRLPGVTIDPQLDAAVDRALVAAEVQVLEITLDGIHDAWQAFSSIDSEAWASNGLLVERAPQGSIGNVVRQLLLYCKEFNPQQVAIARAKQVTWSAAVAEALTRVQVLALPTLSARPVPLGGSYQPNDLVNPFNVSGNPAIALPMPVEGWSIPGSLQLVASHGREDLLCGSALRIESALS